MPSVFKLNTLSQNIKTHTIVISQYSDYNQNPISLAPDIVVDLMTIRQSLDNLFHCKKYLRRYMYDYYVPIDDIIGELHGLDGETRALIRIAHFVEYNEPRVKCYPQLSQITENDFHHYRLDLVHSVEGMQKGNTYKYTTDITIE